MSNVIERLATVVASLKENDEVILVRLQGEDILDLVDLDLHFVRNCASETTDKLVEEFDNLVVEIENLYDGGSFNEEELKEIARIVRSSVK